MAAPYQVDRFLTGQYTQETLTDRLAEPVLDQRKHPGQWFFIFGLAFIFMNVMLMSITYLLYRGVGIWGINVPVGWGFDIINFVWWIGIGHAGTLISAILLLMRQQWRNSINRYAETMTLFAVMCAGMYPLLHTGRPWVAYWLMPFVPNVLAMTPQFRSPLIWDVFAVTTYLTVSALFWFIGLVPDFATLRDRAKNSVARVVFAIGAMGWRGSARHWQRYEQAYLLLAGLSTPLVLSVHSIVSFDFAVSIIPGWHTTIFPPYFVAGAVYAGFAMVLTFLLPVRAWYGLKDFVTMKHIDWMAKIMLATGLIVFYGYILEVFYGWYSGNEFELALLKNRFTGPYAAFYWALILCNGLVPQVLWAPRFRHHVPTLFVVSLIVSIGMWLERFVIIPMSLHRDFIPASWGYYTPTLWDWSLFLGTIGFFVCGMFVFMRVLPMINIFEMKDLLYRQLTTRNGHSHAELAAARDRATSGAPDVSPEGTH